MVFQGLVLGWLLPVWREVRFQGQLRGRRRLGRPERLTARPGRDRSRLRTVAATVSCRVGWTLPQRAGLCASVDPACWAPLADIRQAPRFRAVWPLVERCGC